MAFYSSQSQQYEQQNTSWNYNPTYFSGEGEDNSDITQTSPVKEKKKIFFKKLP